MTNHDKMLRDVAENPNTTLTDIRTRTGLNRNCARNCVRDLVNAGSLKEAAAHSGGAGGGQRPATYQIMEIQVMEMRRVYMGYCLCGAPVEYPVETIPLPTFFACDRCRSKLSLSI